MKAGLKILTVFFAILSIFLPATHAKDLVYEQRGVLKIGPVETPVSVFGKIGEGKSVMQMESQLGTLCRIALGENGEILHCEGSPVFRESWARDFVARDFKNIISFEKLAGAMPPGTAKFGIMPDKYYRVEFCGASPAGGKIIPTDVHIRDKKYSISLKLVSAKTR